MKAVWWRNVPRYGVNQDGVRMVVLVVLLLLGLTVQQLQAQSTRPLVGIAAFETAADPRIEAAADSISSTIDLTLQLLDRYEVRRVGAFRYTGGPAPTAANLRNLDFIVFGSVADVAGRIEIDLSVYSRAENRITANYRDGVDSVFDLFDASDDASIALLESLSGEVIRFATLSFRNLGSPGSYSVYVDGIALGENLQEARVLVGSRSVRIQQERMLRQHTAYEGVETLQEGVTRTVEFRIPLATAEERQTLVSLEQQILDNWDEADKVPVVEQLFSRAFFLLDDIAYSPNLSTYRDSFSALREQYDVRVAEGFPDAAAPAAAIAEESTEDEPAPAPRQAYVRPQPPVVRGAVGVKGGFGLGWWTGEDWLDAFSDHGLDWVAQASVFFYYHLHRNFALQLQLARQRHTTNALDDEFTDDFDFLFHFWTTDLALLLRPTARTNVFMAYLLLGPVLTLTTSEVTLSDYNTRDEEDTFDLETDPFLGFTLGAGLGLRIARAEVFGELLYNRTSFEPARNFEAVSNSIMSVMGIAVQLR